jgi:uncharacterized protein involved in outer membrane biogenesis
MNRPLFIRRGLQCALGAFAALMVIGVLLAIALDSGYFRGAFLRAVAARAGRPIAVHGSFQAHFFSLHPQLTALGVTIGNPPWMAAGTTAKIERIVLGFEWPGFGHPFGIETLDMTGATMHLVRDAGGHSNWQWSEGNSGGSAGLPLIHSLRVAAARVTLDDDRHHLHFDGTVTVGDLTAADGSRPLRVGGEGRLNGKTVDFDITGDPLSAANREKHYGFSFRENSSGSNLTGHGFLLQPFDFQELETTFEATGADLKDLYFLTGVTLINTGAYHFTGRLARSGNHTQLSDLAATSGQSDIRGTVSIDSLHGRPNMTAELHSQFLRLADLGLRAAGRDPASGPPMLLSNVMIKPASVRHGDAVVNFRANRLDVGRISLHSVAAKMTIDQGHVVVAPLSADIMDGKLTVRLDVDATTDLPAADLDLRIAGLQLAELDQKKSDRPPFEGLLRARLRVSGHGSSPHQIAASANGTVTAVLPHGTIRESFAELTGLNLHEVGLLLTKSTQETGVRCAVASFRVQEGTLTAQGIVVDTDPVLIDGEGQIHLDTEALDLRLSGHPKKRRLFHVPSPILVRGTLSHPSIALQVREKAGGTPTPAGSGTQAAGTPAAASPLAAALAFVDPDLAKDVDCAALIGST